MKIAVKFSVQVERARKPQPRPRPQPEREGPPQVDSKGSFILDRAGYQPVGFTADMPDRTRP